MGNSFSLIFFPNVRIDCNTTKFENEYIFILDNQSEKGSLAALYFQELERTWFHSAQLQLSVTAKVTVCAWFFSHPSKYFINPTRMIISCTTSYFTPGCCYSLNDSVVEWRDLSTPDSLISQIIWMVSARYLGCKTNQIHSHHMLQCLFVQWTHTWTSVTSCSSIILKSKDVFTALLPDLGTAIFSRSEPFELNLQPIYCQTFPILLHISYFVKEKQQIIIFKRL